MPNQPSHNAGGVDVCQLPRSRRVPDFHQVHKRYITVIPPDIKMTHYGHLKKNPLFSGFFLNCHAFFFEDDISSSKLASARALLRLTVRTVHCNLCEITPSDKPRT